MNTTATACPVVEPTFDDAIRERDLGIAKVEAAADDWSRQVIDNAIAAFAALREPFSANDIRPWLPEVPGALMGARFLAASKRGELRHIGYVKSNSASTHAHPIARWITSEHEEHCEQHYADAPHPSTRCVCDLAQWQGAA